MKTSKLPPGVEDEDLGPSSGVEVRDNEEVREDCHLFVKGECPHGISGKQNGICKYFHRKICQKFMKWGKTTTRLDARTQNVTDSIQPSVQIASI